MNRCFFSIIGGGLRKKTKELAIRHDRYLGLSTGEVCEKVKQFAKEEQTSYSKVLEKDYQHLLDKNNSLLYSQWIKDIEKPPCGFPGEYHSASFPVFSIVLFDGYGSHNGLLELSVESIRKQTHSNWELLIVTSEQNRFNEFSNIPEIKIYPCHVDGFFQSVNSVLEYCTGSYITFLRAGDCFSLCMTGVLGAYLAQNERTSLVVTDEDSLDDSGRRCHPCFKPDWNPDYLYSYNYFSKALVFESKFLRELGGFNFEASDPYHDLALRATLQLKEEEIYHISYVMFHFRLWEEKQFENEICGGTYRCRFKIPQPGPLVSIIIPTKDQLDLLKNCIDGLLNKTNFESYEIIIIDNQSEQTATLEYLQKLEKDPKIRIVDYNFPFNFSEMNNFAVKEARGEVIAFLNNDVSVLNNDWLTEMVSHACRPEIGCVGAKLFYPDGTIQHGGVILGLKGYASHAHKGFEGDSSGYFNRLVVTHNVSAVTAACMVLRKEVFDMVGGFDAINLKVAYNDVDLCLKVKQAGYRNLFTPHAQLVHHESKSRGRKRNKKQAKALREESAFLRKKWGDDLFQDPAYNKNLTLVREDFSLGLGRPSTLSND